MKKIFPGVLVLIGLVLIGLVFMAMPACARKPGKMFVAPKLPAMVRWTDPSEGAFTVEAPKGWRITGGTRRIAYTDVRLYVRAESPDGKVRVWINAPNILPRQEPNPHYYNLGWYEGMVVHGAAGPFEIERFRTGSQFAQEFTNRHLCRGARKLSAFDMRYETRRINNQIVPVAARAGVWALASAGDYTYRCGRRIGFTYSVTAVTWTTPHGPHTWAVYKLAGYLSDRSTLDIARYVMDSMIASFKIDPAWQARHEWQIHDATGALTEMSNRITQTSVEQARRSLDQNIRLEKSRQAMFDRLVRTAMSGYQQRQQIQSRIQQRWSDITLGLVHGCDDLGDCGEMSNNYQYYWTKDGRTVVGGPSDGSPPGSKYHRWTPDY